MEARVEITRPDTEIEDGSVWRHRNGKDYVVIAVGRREVDLHPVVIYQSTTADDVWVRPLHEFEDGRFTLIRDDYSD